MSECLFAAIFLRNFSELWILDFSDLISPSITFSLQFLINRANQLSQMIINQITENSFHFNKRICSQYDEIVNKINGVAHDTDELVALSNYIDNLRFGPLLSLKVNCFV